MPIADGTTRLGIEIRLVRPVDSVDVGDEHIAVREIESQVASFQVPFGSLVPARIELVTHVRCYAVRSPASKTHVAGVAAQRVCAIVSGQPGFQTRNELSVA